VCKDCRVFTSGDCDGDFLAGSEEFIGDDGVVDFFFEDGVEAGEADQFAGFGTEDEGFVFGAGFADFDHFWGVG